MYSSLKLSSCAEEVDKDDPNDTTYPVCPGVAGYSLQIRQVESGRVSINVVTPSKRLLPLNYQDVVTRSMDNMDDQAEWRVRKENGKVIPIALIVRVMVRDRSNPEKITSKYWAVAKITADGACVTDRIREGVKSATEVRALADSAANRACAARLPKAAATGSH